MTPSAPRSLCGFGFSTGRISPTNDRPSPWSFFKRGRRDRFGLKKRPSPECARVSRSAELHRSSPRPSGSATFSTSPRASVRRAGSAIRGRSTMRPISKREASRSWGRSRVPFSCGGCGVRSSRGDVSSAKVARRSWPRSIDQQQGRTRPPRRSWRPCSSGSGRSCPPRWSRRSSDPASITSWRSPD